MRIAHLSDLHCGRSWMFDPEALRNAIFQINESKPDVTILTGDLTDWGLVHEYEMAKKHISKLKRKPLIVPGNHDARYVGYKLFESIFSEPFGRYGSYEHDSFIFIGMDSSEPDLDEGHIGREQLSWATKIIEETDKTPIIFLHHHLLPIPDTGRERNVLMDAGEVLRMIENNAVPLVLTGHKHISWVWNLNGTVISNVGTVSCHRSYQGMRWNLIDMRDNVLSIKQTDVLSGKTEYVIKEAPLREKN